MKKIYQLICVVVGLTMTQRVLSQTNPYKAPLYWSVYEHHIVKEQNGDPDNYIPEDVFQSNIDWVDANLKDLGYKMVCLDGWGDVTILNENGYRASHSRHWEHDIAWWSQHLQDRGLQLGIYGNPLWVHVADNDMTTKIVGTDIPVSSLKNSSENAWFPWVQVDRPGAEEYVKGYIKYYADMGIKYFRVDFLSWFENGQDRYIGRVGPNRPHEHYVTALKWMREAADEHGVFLSLVMPHLFNEAEVELQYGHMFRINEDTGEGTWWKWAEKDKGVKRVGWSVYANPFDGLTYWSYVAGRNKMILDPDFLRINTFSGNDEKKSVISLCLLSGAPVTVSDQFNTIGADVWVYQNSELLELNADGFVGKPLNNDPNNVNSQIWKGQLSNGEWVVGLFNRSSSAQTRSINFADLGFSEPAHVRDLWKHENLGTMTSFSASVPAHGVIVLKIAANEISGPASMHVSSFTLDEENGKGKATVRVIDGDGIMVEGATVEVKFSASFTEVVSGVTDANGDVVLQTSSALPRPLKINACVISVKRENYIYAADQNAMSCVEDFRYVGGTFNSWKLTRMNWKDSVWVLNDVSINAGSYELKFANTANFTGNDWGDATGLTGRAKLTTGGKPNVKFTIPKDGNYTLTFNENTLWYTIKQSHQKSMYVGGTFNNWALSETPMTLEGDVWKALNVEIAAGDHELKFANTSSWSGDDWGNDSGLTGTAALTTGGDPNIEFEIDESSLFVISFNDVTLEYSIKDQNAITGVTGETERKIFSAYPNPVDGRLTIDSEINGSLEIVNPQGLVVKQVLINALKTDIDVSSLPSGLYVVRFVHGDIQRAQKVMIR